MSNKPTALLQALDERTRLLDELAATGQFDHPAWKGANRVARYDAGAGKCKLADPGAKALLDQADDEVMAIPFVVSTYSIDRDGDVVVPAGLKNWLEAYARNPVWLFAHQPWLLPIGLSRDASGKCTVQILDDRVIATCHFHKETEIARDVYRLTKAGILNATSIGFIPHKGKRLKRVEDPTLERDDVDFDWPGFIFTDWELCEISICVIQSNRDAIRMSLDKGIDGRPLGDQVRHLILPYAPRKASAPSGWGGRTTVLVPKAQYATEAEAVAHALARGLDVSDCCESADGWIFRQPDSNQFCRPAGGDANMGSHAVGGGSNAPADPNKDAGATTTTGGTMTQPNTQTPSPTSTLPVKRIIPRSAFAALGALYGLSAKEVADQAGLQDDPDKQDEGDDEPKMPPGATVLSAVKELCETALPLTEQPDVQKFLSKTLGDAGKCAAKAYPDLDLGFEMVEDDEDEEGPDEDDEEKDDDLDDEEDEDLDEDEEKELGSLLERFNQLTGR